MPLSRLLPIALATWLAATVSPVFAADQTASYAVDTEIKLSSDQRTRGISNSLNMPGVKLIVQAAHESGLIGLAEVSTVSKKQFPEGNGLNLTLAGGYRFGDPDAWHYGVGLAIDLLPGAKFDAPQAFDFETLTPTDVRSTNYNSAFAVLEVGYGALEGRVLNVLSKTYRGANTGGVCGSMLALMPDPTQALECYARGDHGSRGSWLLDLDYRYKLAPATTLNLHVGQQKINNFKEADFIDARIGVSHKQWGFEWSADWVTTRTKVRELYLVQDGDKLRATNGNKLVVAVASKF